jgi:dephospho-CoA kinase
MTEYEKDKQKQAPIGLTGSIATGKSTVSSMLAELGAVIIDADKIAFDAVLKGKPACKKIINYFGESVLQGNGEIDRKALGDIIFNDPDKKQVLNSIVHPEVFCEMGRQINEAEKNQGAVIILDVPLLIESGMNKGMSDVILVYTPEDVQLERLMARDNIDRAAAMAKIRSQMPVEDKRNLATIIIDNSFGIEKTREQTVKVFSWLKNRFAKVD